MMPDPKLTYEILPPSTIVEASFSPEPDDDSEVDVTIEVRNPPANGSVTLRKIQFVLPVAKGSDAATAKTPALTAKPARIQPVSREPNDWAIVFRPEGTGPGTVSFEATPLRDGAVAPDARIAFRLLDLVVIDQEGQTQIDVLETLSNGAVSDRKSLKIRKVPPALRIDSFASSNFAVTAGTEVELSWATTGASLIFLEGLSAADRNSFDQQFPKPPGTQRTDNAENRDLHDQSFKVHPQSTTTYTLRARSNRTTAEAVRQVTVTVTNQVRAPFVAVGDDGFQPGVASGDVRVQRGVQAQKMALGTNASLPANDGDLSVGGALTVGTPGAAGSLAVNGDLTLSGKLTPGDTTLTLDGNLSAGQINAFSLAGRPRRDASPLLEVTSEVKLFGAVRGLAGSMRFLRTHRVFTQTSQRAAGSPVADAEMAEGFPQGHRFTLLTTGIRIPQNEVVLAHWCVPMNNFPDVDKVLCFTQVFELFTNVLEIGVALGATPPQFAIRVAIFALLVRSDPRPTEGLI
jgi:hypothetical protein